MTKRLIGLDGEMSDSELADGAVLVQIGVAFDATGPVGLVEGGLEPELHAEATRGRGPAQRRRLAEHDFIRRYAVLGVHGAMDEHAGSDHRAECERA